MSLHDKLKRLDGLQGRLLEDELYRIVGEEIEAGVKDTAAWVRAVADGVGDDAATKSMYIKHRVRRLQDEVSLNAQASELESQKQMALASAKKKAKSRKELDAVIGNIGERIKDVLAWLVLFFCIIFIYSFFG